MTSTEGPKPQNFWKKLGTFLILAAAFVAIPAGIITCVLGLKQLFGW